MRRRDREDHVLAVAGHDDERLRPDPFEHVRGLHRADRHAADDLVEVRARVDRLAVNPFEDHRERRVGQDRAVRQHAEERDAEPFEALLEDPPEIRSRGQVDLVDDRTADVHALPLEQRGIEHDLVDRAADAALRDDDRGRTEHARHDRVREPDHRSDTGVSGALDEHDVAVTGEAGMRGPDAGRQVLDDAALDVVAREAAWDVDRAHPVERFGQPEHAAHEDRVLVGRDAVLDDRPLADRLDEPDGEASLLESVEDAEADRRLAAVLPRGGEVDVPHGGRRRYPRGAVLRSISWSASRRRAIVSASTASGSRYGPRRSMMSATSPRKTLASATKNCGSLL